MVQNYVYTHKTESEKKAVSTFPDWGINPLNQSLLSIASGHGKKLVILGVSGGIMQGSWADTGTSLFTLITPGPVSADSMEHKGASVSWFEVWTLQEQRGKPLRQNRAGMNCVFTVTWVSS